MRTFLIGLAAASIMTAVSAADAHAQVTRIRHPNGSSTYVDAKGRDIHAAYYAAGAGRHARSWRQHTGGHKAGSPQ